MASEIILLGAGAHQDATMPIAADVGKFISKHSEDIPEFARFITEHEVSWADYEEIINRLTLALETLGSPITPVERKADNSVQPAMDKVHLDLSYDPNKLVVEIEVLIPSLISKALQVNQDNQWAGAYLGNLLEYSYEKSLDIFTLNHDCLLEAIGKQINHNIEVVTEYIPPEQNFVLSPRHDPEDETDTKRVILRKLHGSVDWELVSEGYKHFIKKSTADAHNLKPMLMLNSGRKESINEPFGGNYAQFVDQLIHADHWIIIGYGFNDLHINRLLCTYAERKGRKITVVTEALSDERYIREKERKIRSYFDMSSVIAPEIEVISKGARAYIDNLK